MARLTDWYRLAHEIFRAPPFHGYRPTPRRFANLCLNRIEHRTKRTRLWSRPLKLIVDPVNVCNLRCPCCFTGAGGQGRPRTVMPLSLYRRLLDELGDYIFELEAYNWGEPLLSPHIYTMLAEATERGLASKLNTNFSLPFDAQNAERLIATGLTVLTVSIDGARQETYRQYRVRGKLDTVIANCRLMRDAKRRLGSLTPILNLEFHVFPHNTTDYEAMRALATELDMNFLAFKGAIPGGDWDTDGDWQFCVKPRPVPCVGLWSIAVVNSDGGVAPCRGTFYREDDMGALAVQPGDAGAATFREIWNGPLYQSGRRFFRRRDGSAADRTHVCFECPATTGYEHWIRHVAAGGTEENLELGYTTGDAWNYFWNRRPARPGLHAPEGLPGSRPGPGTTVA